MSPVTGIVSGEILFSIIMETFSLVTGMKSGSVIIQA